MTIYKSKEILKESLVSYIFLIPISVLAGEFLHMKGRVLVLFPALCIMLPALIDSIGGVTSVLAARVTTALHLGTLSLDFRKLGLLFKNIGLVISSGLMTWFLIGILSHTIAISLGWSSLGLSKMVLVTILSGLLATLPILLMVIILAFGIYKYGWDPDNFVSPFATTTGDFIGILSILIILRAIGVI